MSGDDPHGEVRVHRAGADLDDATGAAVALHGRGAMAAGMTDLLAQADRTEGAVAYLAPQAAGRTWYPRSFLEPTDRNQPHLGSALRAVEGVAERARGAVGTDRVLFVGFSQGACLASEFVARTPRGYGGLAAFSGGLIGETVDRDRYDGSVDGMPAYLGCSDVDPHIPEDRVHETAAVLDALGAEVETDIFPGMGHTVNAEELAALSGLLDAIATPA